MRYSHRLERLELGSLVVSRSKILTMNATGSSPPDTAAAVSIFDMMTV